MASGQASCLRSLGERTTGPSCHWYMLVFRHLDNFLVKSSLWWPISSTRRTLCGVGYWSCCCKCKAKASHAAGKFMAFVPPADFFSLLGRRAGEQWYLWMQKLWKIQSILCKISTLPTLNLWIMGALSEEGHVTSSEVMRPLTYVPCFRSFVIYFSWEISIKKNVIWTRVSSSSAVQIVK